MEIKSNLTLADRESCINLVSSSVCVDENGEYKYYPARFQLAFNIAKLIYFAGLDIAAEDETIDAETVIHKYRDVLDQIESNEDIQHEIYELENECRAAIAYKLSIYTPLNRLARVLYDMVSTASDAISDPQSLEALASLAKLTDGELSGD